MPFIDIQFAEFAPDLGGQPPADAATAYLVEAENVYPVTGGYQVFPEATSGGGATMGASGYAQSSPLVIRNAALNDENWIVAGTTSLSQELFVTNDDGATWNDCTRATAYSSALEWDFAIFGDDIIACSGANAPQVKDASASATVTGLFADLTGSPPNARYCTRVRDFLVLGNLPTSNLKTTLRWSSIGDHEDWPTPGGASALASQAGSQVLSNEYGAITALVGFEKYGLIFQEQALTRMTYVGGDVVFSFDRISDTEGKSVVGFAKPLCIVNEDLIIFANYHGVYATDGYSVREIAQGKIRNAIINDNLNYPIPLSAWGVGVYSPDLSLCVMPYSSGTNYGYLLYQPELNRFSRVFEGASTPSTVFFSEVPSSVNERIYGFLRVTDGPVYTNTAIVAVSIDLQTAYLEILPGQKVQIQSAHIIGADVTDPTISFKAADDYDDIDLVQTGFTAMTAANRGIGAQSRDTARFFAFKITGTQPGQAIIRGLRVYYEPAGEL